ncbi:MAG: replication endonuclease, partial [Phycisphaerae bacterium]
MNQHEQKAPAKTQISLPGYLYPSKKRGALPETPAEKKARRRAEERKNKPRCGIVSNHATADWSRRQERLILWGYGSKIVCPGKPDRHLLPFIHPDKVAHRSNGYNIARIHGIADMAKADECIAAALLTLTLPGRMHSAYKGYPNPLWDGSTPEDGRLYFASVTKNIRQRFKRLHRKGVIAYIPWFYRAMEAHKDGTPHQHWVIFFRPGDELLIFQAIDAAYKAEDRDHARRRIKFETCRHFEGAQSYIRKYVTKNTKGLSPGFKNQRVWRSLWGIRAFGTSLGLRAGIYNLLRRFLPPGTGSDCPGELETGVR